MIKKIAWDMFEKTGNINTFLAFKNIEEIQSGNSQRYDQNQGILDTKQILEQDDGR